MSRGDQPDDIFLDAADRHDFIRTLAEARQKTGWQVPACHHYHLVLETPSGNLVGGTAWIQSTYTIRLNSCHRLTGHVERHLERRRLEEVDEGALAEFLEAWSISGEAFRQPCLEKMGGKVSENHPGQTRLQAAAAKVDRILAQELVPPGWTPDDLAGRRRAIRPSWPWPLDCSVRRRYQ